VETLIRLDETFEAEVCALDAAVETTDRFESVAVREPETPVRLVLTAPRLDETFPTLLLMAT
jgi:hypothetical protein